MKSLIQCYLFFILMLFFAGCTKTEGLGGKAKIIGKLTGKFYTDDQLSQFNGLGVLANENVYIVYGTEDTYFDDDIKTSYDGSFEFNYLRPGTYTIYAYENCFPCAALETNKQVTVEITSKDQILDIGTIELKKKI